MTGPQRRPRVFDHTALVALFAAQPGPYRIWQRAERGELTVVMPAAAVAEANHLLGDGDNTWDGLVDLESVVVTPLDKSTAIATGRLAGTLAARHVLAEALRMEGVIVTRAPWQYPPDAPPIRVV